MTKKEVIQEVATFLTKKFSGLLAKVEIVKKEDLDLVSIFFQTIAVFVLWSLELLYTGCLQHSIFLLKAPYIQVLDAVVNKGYIS